LVEEPGRDADLEWLMLDSTVFRAHQHAAGAPRKKAARKAPGTFGVWAAQGAVSRPGSPPPPMLQAIPAACWLVLAR
jgi:hypothetical protein